LFLQHLVGSKGHCQPRFEFDDPALGCTQLAGLDRRETRLDTGAEQLSFTPSIDRLATDIKTT